MRDNGNHLMDIYHGSVRVVEKPVFGAGEQVVLKSKKAFEALTFVKAVKASRQEYFAKYKSRDEEARAKYRRIASKLVAENEVYVLDIIRNKWKNGKGI